MATRSHDSVTDEVAAAALHVHGPTLALMLYGSYARGDAEPASDIDLLQVVPRRPGSYVVGSVAVVAYTLDQLRSMSLAGSLFAWHLRTEGVVLDDPEQLLSAVLFEHPGPATERTLRRVRQLAAVLEVSRREFEQYGPRILRVARYLLRTAMYAQSLAAGETSFSIERAAKAANAEVHLSLVIRAAVETTWSTLAWYRDALVELLDAPLATNRYGSLEALAINSWDTDRQLAAIAVQALSAEGGELDYGILPTPVL
jgi:predicted nucleotidyltransferase